MYGLLIWQTKRPLLNLAELSEAELQEAKDTFPLGTIKKYGEKHLYVKVGGKKPWVYYATLGTEKADAAIKAGGVVVVNGKGVAPATPENLAKHGVAHPHEGGTPPALGLEPAAPAPSGPVAAGGVVSAPAVAPAPKPKKPKKVKAPEPEAKAEPVAPPPPEPPAVDLSGWEGFPDPTGAKNNIHHLVAAIDKVGGDPDKLDPDAAKAFATIFGPAWSHAYGLARSVQSLSGASGKPLGSDPHGIIAYAQTNPTFSGKMTSLYGVKWAEKAKAFGTALQAAGALAPQAVKAVQAATAAAAPPAPSPPPAPPAPAPAAIPTLADLATKLNNKTPTGNEAEDLLKKHPSLAKMLSDMYGVDAPVVAYLANQIVTKGPQETLKGYKDPPSSHIIHAAIKKLANDLGTPLPDEEAPPPPPPAPPPTPDLSGFVQAIKDIGHPVANITQLSHLSLSMPPAALAGYYDPNGAVASGIEVATVAHAIVHGGLTKAAHDYGHLMTADGMHKLWKALGEPPAPAPKPAPAPPPPAPSPPAKNWKETVSSYALQNLTSMVKTPKKGQAYQAIKKMGLLGAELDSPTAKVVALLHKGGTYDFAVGRLVNYGFKKAEAEEFVTEVVQQGLKAKAFDWDGDQGIPTFPELKGSKKKPTPVGTVPASGMTPTAPAAPKAVAPPPPSAIPSGIPSPGELTLKGSAQHLGGAGSKRIYVDAKGKEYLFKVAASKSGSKVEPHRAEVQAAFSAFARRVKPNHPPIGVLTLDGQLGTLYPFVEAKGNLKGVAPASLTDTEKFDVASEHILDWLGSQHDSHSANLLRTADGRIIGVDKEQGFKYFPNDKLDIDYHPNSKYGENEPFYNTFWRDWSNGKFEFDPKTLADPIQKAMAVSGKDYADMMTPYAATLFPGDKVRQANFIRKVVNRKNTLRRDYEKFLTKLHEKRYGTSGSFTFAAGWVPKTDADKPYEKTVIVTPEKHVPEQKHTAATLLATLPGTSKTAPYTPKGSDKEDPTKITVKTTAGPEALKALLKQMGFGDVDTKTGGHYTMAFVDRAKWDAFSQVVPAHTIPAVTKKEMVYPGTTIASHSGQATYFPAMRASEPTDANVDMLKKITKDTRLRWMGTRITMDGPAVEQQVGRVYRKKDAKGEYYEVHFKLRAPVLKTITGGKSESFVLPQGTYDEKTDTQIDDPSLGGNPAITARKFETKHGEAFVVPVTGGSGSFAMQGSVYARIRTGPENIHQALGDMLEQMQVGLADKVLREPTAEEREVVALSAALKAVAPQIADQVDKDEMAGALRTPALLRQKLKGRMTDEEIASLGQVEILPNHAGVVAPGRWRRLGGTTDPSNPNVRFLMWEVSTPEKVINMFRGNGPASIHDRGLQGLAMTGASVSEDIRTGAADNITMRVVTRAEDSKSLGQGWGDIRLIFAPDELDRLDPFFHFGDKYGCVNPEHPSYGGAFRNRNPLDKDLTSQMGGASSGELVIRRGVPTDKVARISCASEEGSSGRKALIKALRAAGLEEINGVPVEDFVVVASTRGEVYQQYIKPAGY